MTKAKEPDKTFLIHCQRDETEEQAVARTMLSPALQSAGTIQQYSKSPIDLDLAALIDCLEEQVDQLKDGNLKRIEQMLLSQAHALDAIANNLFRRAKPQEYLNQFETHMKLGLKAQSQCLATLGTLVSMKKPTNLKQTNIGYNQQVNNAPNKLVEEKSHNERLDQGTSQETVGANVETDPQMATVAASNRTKEH